MILRGGLLSAWNPNSFEMIVWEGMAVIEEKCNMEISCEAMNDILQEGVCWLKEVETLKSYDS